MLSIPPNVSLQGQSEPPASSRSSVWGYFFSGVCVSLQASSTSPATMSFSPLVFCLSLQVRHTPHRETQFFFLAYFKLSKKKSIEIKSRLRLMNCHLGWMLNLKRKYMFYAAFKVLLLVLVLC